MDPVALRLGKRGMRHHQTYTDCTTDFMNQRHGRLGIKTRLAMHASMFRPIDSVWVSAQVTQPSRYHVGFFSTAPSKRFFHEPERFKKVLEYVFVESIHMTPRGADPPAFHARNAADTKVL